MHVWINCKYTPPDARCPGDRAPVAPLRATGGKLLNGAGGRQGRGGRPAPGGPATPPQGRQGMAALFKPPHPLLPLILFSKIPEKIEKRREG